MALQLNDVSKKIDRLEENICVVNEIVKELIDKDENVGICCLKCAEND